MRFVTKKPPIVQSSAKTFKKQISLHIALIIVSLAAIIANGTYAVEGEYTGFVLEQSFTAFGMLALGAIIAVVVELFYRLSEGDTTRFSSYRGFIDPINTGLLIALLLPLTTPIYVLALAVIVGTYAGKLVFGGYGFYIFNPALVGVLFVSLSFSNVLAVADTPLLMLKNVFSGGTFNGISLLELLNGSYQEVAIGSTVGAILVLLFIYLTVSKVIDLRLSGTFLLTVLVMSLGIGYILWAFDGSITLTYVLVNMFTGLTLFGAVFLVSEPVSTPTSRETKILFGVVVAVIMMLTRTLSDNVEGLVFAVLFGNLLTPFINRTVKRSNKQALIKTLVGCILLVVIATAAIGFMLQSQLIELNSVAAMLGGII